MYWHCRQPQKRAAPYYIRIHCPDVVCWCGLAVQMYWFVTSQTLLLARAVPRAAVLELSGVLVPVPVRRACAGRGTAGAMHGDAGRVPMQRCPAFWG
jgi:hypothetical protein